MDKTNLNRVERDLVEGLDGFLVDLKGNRPIRKKYSCRQVVLNLRTRAYGPKEVKTIRALLKVSQALFAQFLGVSPQTVRAWERGQSPSDIACRFMDEIHRDPPYWRERLREVAKVKVG